MNSQMNWQILQMFCPDFGFKVRFKQIFRILQFQQIADSSIYWARNLDFVCNKAIFARIQCETLMADLVNKS